MIAPPQHSPRRDNPGPPSSDTVSSSAADSNGDPARIRAALTRNTLAAAHQRRALARRLAVTETEVLAIQHLARRGALTPGQLTVLLQLSSGGTAGLVRRLQDAGDVTRHAHPSDRRSVVLTLIPACQNLLAKSWAPLVADLEAMALALTDSQQQSIRHFLEHAADATERHAERLSRDADATTYAALAVELPALWE